MAVADRAGLPVCVCIASASPHETTLVQAVLDKRFLAEKPQRLIGDKAYGDKAYGDKAYGDKAYDSDPLDALLAAQGIALIAPHRRNRKREATQDGRVLRRYKRRWKVERLFAWLQQFRRLVVRYEWTVSASGGAL